MYDQHHPSSMYTSVIKGLSLCVLFSMLHSTIGHSEPTSNADDVLPRDAVIDSTEVNLGSDNIPTAPPEDTGGPPTTEELLQQIDMSKFDLPIPINESVIYWVDHFSNSGRWSASRWIRASGKYRNLIRAELKKANLPQDLMYMAMIESGFDPTAESQAEAVGVWQFIPSTGQQYGLVINDVIDERRDPIRSTQAAIGYLSKLNREFGGNWHLAMASYNAGEKRIYKAVSEKGTINYWELREALAEETQFYVPKILAMAILDKYPELFGVPKTANKEKPLILKQVSANKNQHVSTLADMAEMQVEEFLSYNPHILKERLLVEESTVRIYVPPNKAEAYTKNSRSTEQDRLSSGRQLTKDELNALGMQATTTDVSHHQRSFEHTVKEGDSWDSIAKQYTLSPTNLRRWNQEIETLEPQVGDIIQLSKPKAKTYIQHTVSAKESLSSLAKKYDCSVEDIRNWNGLGEEQEVKKDDVLWIRQ